MASVEAWWARTYDLDTNVSPYQSVRTVRTGEHSDLSYDKVRNANAPDLEEVIFNLDVEYAEILKRIADMDHDRT